MYRPRGVELRCWPRHLSRLCYSTYSERTGPTETMEETGKTLKNPEKPTRRLYDFGPFRADPQKRVLLKDGQPVALTGKPFDILLALLESHGELLTKDQLSGRLWPDTVVEEGNLWRNVSSLRKALGESPDGRPYIVTQARQGYRFVGDVRECRQNVDPPGEGVPIVSNAPLTGVPRRWRRLTLAAACAGLLSVAALLIPYVRTRPSGPALHSLAVLPLVNLSGDSAQDYFADGITEELITALAQIEPLQVTSRTSVMRYKNTRKPIDQIARELKVDAVLEGSAMRTGEHVRITAQLIRTSTDTHVWARSYDGELRDLLGFEREVATAIAREVAVKLAPKTAAVTRPLNPEAYELYLKGRYFWNRRDTQDLIKAADYFAQAVAKDPGYAPAYAGLADASDLHTFPRTSGALGALAKARLAAAKAASRRQSAAKPDTSLAGVKVLADWDWSGAEREFQRALALDPRSAPAHHRYATLLLAPLGRTGKAADEMRRAWTSSALVDLQHRPGVDLFSSRGNTAWPRPNINRYWTWNRTLFQRFSVWNRPMRRCGCIRRRWLPRLKASPSWERGWQTSTGAVMPLPDKRVSGKPVCRLRWAAKPPAIPNSTAPERTRLWAGKAKPCRRSGRAWRGILQR